MTKASSWKVWLVLIGVFVAGAVAGGFISLRVAARIVEQGRGPNQFAPRLLQHLSDRLELSDDQRRQVRVMVGEAWEELREQRQASRDTMRELDSRISTVLTAEQKEKYAELQERQRQRWQALEERRRGAVGANRPPRDGQSPHPPGGDKPRPPPGKTP